MSENIISPIDDIESLAERYSIARGQLADEVNALNLAIAALRSEHLPGIRATLAAAANLQSSLHAAIVKNPDLFIKPRTKTLYGVKIGFAKSPGKIDFEDADAVIARIKKLFPDQVDILIKVTEKPVKDALEQMTAADLKRLGVTVTDSSDKVVIKPVDTDVDKLVDALLKDAGEVGV